MTREVAVIASACAILFGCDSRPRDHRESAAPSPAEPTATSQPAPTQTVKATLDVTGRAYRIPVSAGTAKTVVHQTSKKDELVLVEMYTDKITFTALISRRKFEEVMTLRPPTYFQHKGIDYVRNDGMLFWGEVGKQESVSVDGKVFSGFALVNPSQISAEGEAARAALEAVRKGHRLKLEKHYWGGNNEKAFPSFALDSIRADLARLGASSESSVTVTDADTRCRQEGPRAIVWIETSHGAFALNGQATELVNIRRSAGTPWLDSTGRPVGIGRDVLGVEVTAALIEAGLRKCETK